MFLEHGYAGATMRAIASLAGVSVPTVETSFGTKAGVLKAAIDVAIAGDDAPVPMLDRSWASDALRAATVADFLTIAAGVLGPAQVRSAGLVLAVFDGSRADPELADLSSALIARRAETAAWLVDTLVTKAPLQPGISRPEAIDTVWLLMDPVVFDRATRQRHWTREHYERWFARSLAALLTDPDTTSRRAS